MVRRLPVLRSNPIRPGGHHGGIGIRRYWDLNAEIAAGAQNQIEDEGDAVASLGEVLRKAVRRQMVSDVPLGAFLSGGVDSSAIVALMQAQSERNRCRPLRSGSMRPLLTSPRMPPLLQTSLGQRAYEAARHRHRSA